LLSTRFVYACVSVYYPVSVEVYPVESPVIFLDPGRSDVAVSLGPNSVSADVTVYASNVVDMLNNPDFYSGLDYWFCDPGDYLSCYWLSGDAGASGGVGDIYGYVEVANIYTVDDAYLLQFIRMPSSPVVGGVVNIVYKLYDAPYIYSSYFTVGFYDPQDGLVWESVGVVLSVSDAYKSTSISVDVSGLEPGREYIFFIHFVILVTLWSGYADFRVDYVQLTFNTQEYSFSGIGLKVNVTSGGPYYTRLVLRGWDLDPSLDCNITFINRDLTESTPIVIKDGAPVSLDTSEVDISIAPAGYSSGWIYLVLSKSDGVSRLTLEFQYYTVSGGGGANVTYPVTIVIDPVDGSGGGESLGGGYTQVIRDLELNLTSITILGIREVRM